MEDEAQKMVALKKAYADIILNTAKESAARVMASERKALRFQHDLRSTRDEALRMLVRLKQMVDSKTSEAQITSLKQQRRIDELEAQLQEAEDIITDLRSDLKRVWSELERVKNNQVQPLNEQLTREDASFSENPTREPIISSPSGSGHVTVPTYGMKSIPVNKGMDHKCCNALKQTDQFSVSDLDKFDAPESDLASIIMRTKEPELLRNGCTQRIRAFERNLLDEKLLPSGFVYNPNSNGKNEFIIKAGDKEEGKCNSLSFRNNSTDEVKNPSVGETKKPLKVRTLRRKKTRFGKAKASRKCRLISQDDACILPSIKAENVDITRSSSGLEEELQHNSCYYTEKVKIIQKGKRKRKINSKDGITSSFTSTDQPSSVLSRCRTFAYLVNGGVKSCEDRPNTTENEAKMKPLPRLDPGLTLIRSDVDPISGSTSVTVSLKGINKCGAVQNAADKDMELINEPALIKQKLESDTVENSEAPSSEIILETANVSSMNSEIKDVTASDQSNGSPSHVDNGRLLKYTFQRKRKNSSSSPGETPCAKRRMEEKECIAPQPQMIDESSRDSRRLAQVARQLISLSGKRWC